MALRKRSCRSSQASDTLHPADNTKPLDTTSRTSRGLQASHWLICIFLAMMVLAQTSMVSAKPPDQEAHVQHNGELQTSILYLVSGSSLIAWQFKLYL